MATQAVGRRLKCPNQRCGKWHPPDAAVCSRCGTSLAKSGGQADRAEPLISTRALAGLLACLLLAVGAVLVYRSVAADRSSRRTAPAALNRSSPDLISSLLMADPQIVNTHEHLLGRPDTVATLAEVNRRAGVKSTVLVGSSRYTFYLDKSGFVDHHKNNDFLCRLAKQNPEEYYAFVTFDPEEEGIVRRLEDYVGRGATGVKLYAGHGAATGDERPFHVCPLDDPKLLPLYEYCEAHGIPICLHINLRKFEAEARRVFERFPNLPLIVPHFGLWSATRKRANLDSLLDEYPLLMTDNSFGWWYSVEGFRRYDPANDQQPPSFRDFVIKHQDRILFGTDVVITAAKSKSADALTDFWLAYRCSLELEEFDFVDRKGKVHHFKGLALPEEVVRKIYHENWDRFLERCGRGKR